MGNGGFKRPNAPLVISLVALFVTLGGTGYAALSVPQNSVGTKQLKNGSVTTKKIKNGAVTGAKLNLRGVIVPSAAKAAFASTAGSANSATSATNATNAANLNGQPGSVYKPQWAKVEANATIDAQSGGISVVREPATGGEYLVVFPASVIGHALSATLRWGPSQGNGGGSILVSPCSGGTGDISCGSTATIPNNSVFVETDNASSAATQDHGFYIEVLP